MRYILFFLLIWNISQINGQPPICGNNPIMTSFCTDACIICDIDGFTGRNDNNVTGQAPPGFCTSFVHNMKWIGFIAGSISLTIEFKVTNCTKNAGLEVGLYKSLDCSTFTKVSECDTDIRPNTTKTFVNTTPLVIGQYYYLVMDGSNGDVCNWNIKVTSGTTKVLPLKIASDIIAPNVVCQNDSFEIKTPGVVGGTFYNWTLDGAFLKNSTSFKHVFKAPGDYRLCLNPSNVCDIGPQSCTNVRVLQQPRSSFNQEICFGECFLYKGQPYCQTGTYDVKFQAANGCDSIVTLNLLVDDRVTATTDLYVCQGDTLKIGNGNFHTEGVHQTIIKNEESCSIYLTINLKVIVCNIQSVLNVTPVNCNGENSGNIKFRINAGTPPFNYTGFKVENPSIKFTGSFSALNSDILLSNMDEGNYSITIKDNFGNSKIINAFVPQPSLLQTNISTSDYSGFGISCNGMDNGFLKFKPLGGTMPYTFKHQGITSQADSLKNLKAGTYLTTVTDKNGCKNELNIKLSQPDSLKLNIDFVNPDCSDLNSGTISIKQTSGGNPPFLYTLNNISPQSSNSFAKLSEGVYLVTVKDKNLCSTSISGTLIAPEIPILNPSYSDVEVNLGDLFMSNISSNLIDQKVSWNPNTYVECDTCLQTHIKAINSQQFKVIVISKDGCLREAIINVAVTKKRNFILSNILTANSDAQNDKLTYFAGNDVASINHLSIYGRWGHLVYQIKNLSLGFNEVPWDTRLNGQYLEQGIYTWICEVRFIDEETILFSGTITLLR